MNPPCPYCGKELKRNPTRASKCPHCGARCAVRTSQRLYDHHVLTTAQSQAVDAFARASVLQVERDGPEYFELVAGGESPVDAALQLWKERIDLRDPRGTAAGEFNAMSFFLASVGRDPTPARAKCCAAQLRGYKSLEARGVRIIVAVSTIRANECAACKSLDRQEYDIDSAMQLAPLPHPNCSNVIAGTPFVFCRCSYELLDASAREPWQ